MTTSKYQEKELIMVNHKSLHGNLDFTEFLREPSAISEDPFEHKTQFFIGSEEIWLKEEAMHGNQGTSIFVQLVSL